VEANKGANPDASQTHRGPNNGTARPSLHSNVAVAEGCLCLNVAEFRIMKMSASTEATLTFRPSSTGDILQGNEIIGDGTVGARITPLSRARNDQDVLHFWQRQHRPYQGVPQGWQIRDPREVHRRISASDDGGRGLRIAAGKLSLGMRLLHTYVAV
jgi:hypothetical protein